MSRGDQRDRDRQKNQAKLQAKTKAQGKGGDPLKRNENDKAALEAKIAAKQQAKANEANNNSTSKGPVPRKKVDKKKESLDDLLSAGLNAGKKKAVKA